MNTTPWILLKNSDKRFTLTSRVVTIGSSADCHISLNSPAITPRAAHLLFTAGTYELQALGNKVTIFINEKKCISRLKLKHGDCIRIGDFEMLYGEKEITNIDKKESSGAPSPVIDLISTVAGLLHSKDSSLFDSLVISVARLMRCDAARLVVEEPLGGERKTLTRYPASAGLDRFSKRAVDWAAESSQSVIMHADQWRDGEQSMQSLEANMVASVLCAPLRDDSMLIGYLYLDRVTSGDGFTVEDKELLDALLPLLSEILANFNEKQRQKDAIEQLQQCNSATRGGMIFESEIMQNVLQRALRFARTDSPVLIQGETGTGKELMAQFIHEQSSRSTSVFKAINCGAIPENLIESELFGHEKGAFTGAVQRKVGLFEAAEGGTVFLDEMGELPLQLQVRLLRVLQESEITRIGGTATIRINVRIVAATNRNLEQEIMHGTFRQDLYFRLHVLTIDLPPLRERGADVHLLLEYFNKRYCQQFGLPQKIFSSSVKKQFLLHTWPGNIRELENVVQKAILMSDHQTIGSSEISLNTMSVALKSTTDTGPLTLKDARNRAEKGAIINALLKTNGNVSLSSKILETDRKWIMKKMEEFDICADQYRQR